MDILEENQRYLFKFSYVGKGRFYGSQRQKKLSTIEGCLIDVLLKKRYILNIKNSEIEFASRTDRYVSALGAAFSFLPLKPPVLMEINSGLPKELGVWAYVKVQKDFLSRYNALLRHYKYIVPVPLSNLRKNFKIDLPLMEKACQELEGQHDFKNFSKSEKAEVKTIRTMDSVKMNIDNDFLVFNFKSKAYLRQQIRRMVKKVLDLGMGLIDYDDFLKLFDPSQDISYQPADPSGLILWDIEFGENVHFVIDMKSINRMKGYFFNQEMKFKLKHQLFSILQQHNFS